MTLFRMRIPNMPKKICFTLCASIQQLMTTDVIYQGSFPRVCTSYHNYLVYSAFKCLSEQVDDLSVILHSKGLVKDVDCQQCSFNPRLPQVNGLHVLLNCKTSLQTFLTQCSGAFLAFPIRHLGIMYTTIFILLCCR